jgi:hypothetical protein
MGGFVRGVRVTRVVRDEQSWKCGPGPRIAVLVAIVAAIVPASLVYALIQPVPTMIIPIALAAMPLLGRTVASFRALSFCAAALLMICVLLGGFSVGLLFVPASLAALCAGLLARRRQADDHR